jgi:hypothetical protein
MGTLRGVDYVAESNLVDRQIRNLRAATPGQVAAAALHRYGARPRLSVLADVQREWSGGRRVLTPADRGDVASSWMGVGTHLAFTQPGARRPSHLSRDRTMPPGPRQPYGVVPDMVEKTSA